MGACHAIIIPLGRGVGCPCVDVLGIPGAAKNASNYFFQHHRIYTNSQLKINAYFFVVDPTSFAALQMTFALLQFRKLSDGLKVYNSFKLPVDIPAHFSESVVIVQLIFVTAGFPISLIISLQFRGEMTESVTFRVSC